MFDSLFNLSKQDDGSATLSIRLNDELVLIKSLSRNQIEMLYVYLENFLKEEEEE